MLETCCEHLHRAACDGDECRSRLVPVLPPRARDRGPMRPPAPPHRRQQWRHAARLAARIGAGLGRAQTRAFIARHHAHCAPPVMWRFDAAIYNGNTMLGLAIVGNPVAPGLMLRGILEVNRLCLRRDLPDALRWNAASMLYGWCAREARRRGWRKIITYTRADEPGTSCVLPGGPRRRRCAAAAGTAADGRGPTRMPGSTRSGGRRRSLRLPPLPSPSKEKKGGLRRRPPSFGRKRPRLASSHARQLLSDRAESQLRI